MRRTCPTRGKCPRFPTHRYATIDAPRMREGADGGYDSGSPGGPPAGEGCNGRTATCAVEGMGTVAGPTAHLLLPHPRHRCPAHRPGPGHGVVLDDGQLHHRDRVGVLDVPTPADLGGDRPSTDAAGRPPAGVGVPGH